MRRRHVAILAIWRPPRDAARVASKCLFSRSDNIMLADHKKYMYYFILRGPPMQLLLHARQKRS